MGVTIATHIFDLDGLSVGHEARVLGFLFQELADGRIVKLSDPVARSANEKLAGMPRFRGFATNEGVQAIDAMNQPGIQEEFQGAIDGGWRKGAFALFEGAQYVICPDRRVPIPHELEHAPANGRELQVPCFAELFSGEQRTVHARPVIVPAA